ncbi:ImmA/IrrE family metallo-endopeptidase [Pseudolysinimonas yzui]|uniref:IrrE N-terminal-like domain-containing protein n=1 Tax=Pseudolysinimonas yzui TaxID=2708254 RepID=A0A8J3GMM2_9MICO|nr:hypothetical protein GCM10011600_01410 [Pseudolysinimonas yzui]
MGDPRFHVWQVAEAFGLPVTTRPGLASSGSLQLIHGRVTILVNEASRARKRFSAAHELAHYLLALEENLPLVEQLRSRKIESYCDRFASHLLLPRGWLLRNAEGVADDLPTAIALSTWADCSVPAVVSALNDRGGWNRRLVSWRKFRSGWRLMSVVGGRRGATPVLADPHMLNVATEAPRVYTLPFVSERGMRDIATELVRRGPYVYGLPREAFSDETSDDQVVAVRRGDASEGGAEAGMG